MLFERTSLHIFTPLLVGTVVWLLASMGGVLYARNPAEDGWTGVLTTWLRRILGGVMALGCVATLSSIVITVAAQPVTRTGIATQVHHDACGRSGHCPTIQLRGTTRFAVPTDVAAVVRVGRCYQVTYHPFEHPISPLYTNPVLRLEERPLPCRPRS